MRWKKNCKKGLLFFEQSFPGKTDRNSERDYLES